MWLLATPKRRHCIVVLLIQVFLMTTWSRAEEEAKQLVRMPLIYEQGMVVVVSSEGAGGVRFFEAFEMGNESGNGIVGVSYQWRYLERKPDAVEKTGTGRVFAKLVDGAVHHGSSMVTCGPIQLTWNPVNRESGFVQYKPREVAVHPVAAEYFADKKAQQIQAVELSRFLYLDEAAIKEHGAEVYSGPDSEPRRYKADTSGPVKYAGCVLVAKDPAGIATFKFGRVFERNQSQDEKHHVVTYEFTFMSHDGKSSQAGNGEVYERYVGNQYNGGRLNLEAGPLHLAWSRGGNDSGWVYYDPTWIRVWEVDPADAEALTSAVRVTDFMPELENAGEK
jgi:hypothetical protein